LPLSKIFNEIDFALFSIAEEFVFEKLLSAPALIRVFLEAFGNEVAELLTPFTLF